MSKPRSGQPTAVLTEKRAEPRIDTSISATVVFGKRRVPFTIDNLSASGARLNGPLPLARGDKVRLIIAFDQTSLETLAEVVRVHSADLVSDQVAVRFVDLPAATETAIRGFVARSAAASDGGEVDDERITTQLPKQLAELDAATMRYVKKKKDKP
jgi:hypothetical protein